ncbi:uncharacterized protein LOC126802886 [Argentina anserina]|uniref:uncharacterized protein LOC126802886 n=1 Tax=Argentina anserina TaxID=57926 RepID=UPI00217658B9|nr:uncharacterized protein LOC126802886 [Potentilla anserina]
MKWIMKTPGRVQVNLLRMPINSIFVAVIETSANSPAHNQPLPLCTYKIHPEKTTKGSSSEDPAEDGQAEATSMEVEVAGVGISAKTPLHDQPLLLCGVDSENTLEGSSNPGGTAKSPLHNQYLAVSVDEMYSEHTAEGLSNDTETANHQNEVTGRQDEAGGMSGEIGGEQTPHLPFEKKLHFGKCWNPWMHSKGFRNSHILSPYRWLK